MSEGARRSLILHTPAPTAAQHGFTLLEMLVVVFIIGIMASMVSITIGTRVGQSVRDTADNLRDLFLLAQEEAALRNQWVGMRFSRKQDSDAYSHYEWLQSRDDGSSWQLLSNDFFSAESVAKGVGLELDMEDQDRLQTLKQAQQNFAAKYGQLNFFSDKRGEQLGQNAIGALNQQDESDKDKDKKKREQPPQLLFYPDGGNDQFSLTVLSLDDELRDLKCVVEGDLLGNIKKNCGEERR